MARLNILEYPDPRLREIARPVEDFGPGFQRLADDMIETLNDCGAIGLAAPQVGAPFRVVLIDVSADRNSPRLFVNPEVLSRSALGIVEESCLSVPGVVENIRRYTQVRVRAVDRHGAAVECGLEGLEAVCLLHELDHLEGKLFIDRLGFYRRLRVRRRLAGRMHSPYGAAGSGGGVSSSSSAIHN